MAQLVDGKENADANIIYVGPNSDFNCKYKFSTKLISELLV